MWAWFRLLKGMRTVRLSGNSLKSISYATWAHCATISSLAYSLPDEAKRAQEVRPFRKIDDSFKKIIVTKDIVPAFYDENGILTMNIYDFLLDVDSLEKTQ